jgi:hypothetical protein
MVFVLPAAGLAALSISLVEWCTLEDIDHPKPVKISCLSCHSDKKTLAAMADKAGDPLYLVHSGQLTRGELDSLSGRQSLSGK